MNRLPRRGVWVALSGEEPDDCILKQSGGIGLIRSEYMIRRSGSYFTEYNCVQQVREYLTSVLNRAAGEVWYRLADLEERDVQVLHNGPRGQVKTDNPILGSRGAARWAHNWEELTSELEMIRPFMGRTGFGLLLPYVRDDANLADALKWCRNVGVDCRIGAMIETPAAALAARAIFELADFAVIGTNDLTTLTLGCQRTDAAYTAAHPAVVSQIRAVIKEGMAVGKPVKVAGNFGVDLVEQLTELPAENFIVHYANWGDMVEGAPAEYNERWLSADLRKESDAKLVAADLLHEANSVAISGISTPTSSK